jgi:hypothetical protein
LTAKMPSFLRVAAVSALLAVVQGQGVIQSAQGTSGSPASLPLQGTDLPKASGRGPISNMLSQLT